MEFFASPQLSPWIWFSACFCLYSKAFRSFPSIVSSGADVYNQMRTHSLVLAVRRMHMLTFSYYQNLVLSLFLVLLLACPLGDVGHLWFLSLVSQNCGFSFSEICSEYDIMGVVCGGLTRWKTGFVPCIMLVSWWRVMIRVTVDFWCLLALLGLNSTSSTKARLCGQCGRNTGWYFIDQNAHNTRIPLLTCENIKSPSPLWFRLMSVHVSILVPCFAVIIFMTPVVSSHQTSWPNYSLDRERCEDEFCSSLRLPGTD